MLIRPVKDRERLTRNVRKLRGKGRSRLKRMPREWKIKIVSDGSYIYLSPLMDVLKSKSELLAAVTVSNGYSQEDVNKIKMFCE